MRGVQQANRRPVLLFARHGEAEHNVALDGREFAPHEVLELFTTSLEDPPLTSRGVRQAQGLAATLASLPDELRPTIVVASTQTRALQTALIATASSALGGGGDVCVIGLEELRERHGRWLCERRRNKAALLVDPRLSSKRLDLRGVTEADSLWSPLEMETRAAAAARAAAAVRWLAARCGENGVVLVVSHGGFLRSSIFSARDGALALRDREDGEQLAALRQRAVNNCELRAVRLDELDPARGAGRPRAELLFVQQHDLLPGERRADFVDRKALALRNMQKLWAVRATLSSL